MKGPSGVAVALVLGALLACSGSASAQGDPRQAIDRFDSSERGSEWFANESLDIRGRLRPSVGYVLALSNRSRVVTGAEGGAPVKDLAYLHLGGSLVLVDRLRLAFDLPFQVHASGESRVEEGVLIPAPPKEGGVGDLRLTADVRAFGEHRRGLTGALGVQAWAPTGQKSQWSSDGVFRARPRLMLAGEHGAFVWAAQLGFFARERSEVTASAAAGVRVAKAIVVGPEIFASTAIEEAFSRRVTPIEALFGAHWLVDGTARIGLGVGGGLTDGIGAPSWRAVLGIEWAPEIPTERRARKPRAPGSGGPAEPDEDHDTVPDSVDACPRVVGLKTDDPRTNGCPPDADGDLIDDVADACPTVRGLATLDPATNGCPDRDRDQDGIPNELDACPDERGAADIDPHRNGCPKAFARGSRIEVLDPVEFKPGSAEIVAGEDNEALLTAVLKVLLELPAGRKLKIEGHTDSRGDRRLAAARAASVAKWLVEHGIDAARISTESVGSERPVATNETEAGRAQNRRLEFHLEP